MNFVDIAILAVLAAFLVKGLWRGLLREVCSFLGLLIGAFLAFRFGGTLAEMMAANLHLPEKLCEVVSFLLLFLATVLFFMALGSLLSRFVRLPLLNGLNRVAGGFFGLAEGVLLLAVALFFFSAANLPPGLAQAYRKSHLAPPFVDLGQATCEGSRHLLAS